MQREAWIKLIIFEWEILTKVSKYLLLKYQLNYFYDKYYTLFCYFIYL